MLTSLVSHSSIVSIQSAPCCEDSINEQVRCLLLSTATAAQGVTQEGLRRRYNSSLRFQAK